MQTIKQKRPEGLKEIESIENLLGREFFWVGKGYIAGVELSEDKNYILTTVYKRKGKKCVYHSMFKCSLNLGGENVIPE